MYFTWNKTYCANSSDIEQICSRFHERYADPQGLITISSDGRVKMTYIKGPEGCLFELVEEIK